MLVSLSVLVLASTALAAPLMPDYKVYNDGSRGSVTGPAADFGATYHASAFLSRRGCSSTAQITRCYAADLAADANKQLETKDYKPYVAGGVGTKQRALLVSPPHYNTTGLVVTHTVRLHISTASVAMPAGGENAVTLVGLRNRNPDLALDLRVRNWTDPVLCFAASSPGNFFDERPVYALADVAGLTLEVTYRLGVDGALTDPVKGYVAEVSAKDVLSGEELFYAPYTMENYAGGFVDATEHRLVFGADRRAAPDMQELKYVPVSASAPPTTDAFAECGLATTTTPRRLPPPSRSMLSPTGGRSSLVRAMSCYMTCETLDALHSRTASWKNHIFV